MANNNKTFPKGKASKTQDKVLGAGSLAQGTQEANKPITSKVTQTVTQDLFLQAIDRSPKHLGLLRNAHIAGESVNFPVFYRLYDIYADVILDLMVSGLLNKRTSQVVNKKLSFVRNGQPDPVMAKVIRKKAFKETMREIVRTKFWGRNGLEYIPGKDIAFNLVPKKHIQRKTQRIVIQQTDLTTGIDYTDWANGWILGEPHDLGLLLMISYIALLKKGVIADWAQYIQMFGSPIMVLKYKGFDMSAKDAADKILRELKNAARITIPEEMGLTFEDGKMANGTGDLQEKFCKYADELLEILILGNTETTSHSGTGTGAKSKVHSEQQLEIIKDDMDDICDALNSEHFMNILRSYNYDVDGGEFQFDREVDVAYIAQMMPVIVQAGTQLGLPLSKKQLYEVTGLQPPIDEADAITLFPTLGQPPTVNDPDTQDGQPAGRPAKPVTLSKSKGTPKALSLDDVSAMLDEKLKAFFAPAR